MAPILTKSNSTKSHLNKIQPPPRLHVSYMLYLHRQELKKKNTVFIRKACTKLQLTQELITNTVKNVHKCTPNDLQILSRETIFKKNLARQIASMKYLHFMQTASNKQQMKQNVNKQRFSPQQQQESLKNPSDNIIPMEDNESST